jgi:nitrate reductase cytochrome c-type subunit
MKYNSFLKLILFGFVCAVMATSCVKEGPMGPAGADGVDGAAGSDGRDGVDGQVTCLVCHSGTNMESKSAEFVMSAHNVGAIAVDYAGGRASCAKCHSHEGFTQYAVFGSVLGDITNPSAWECSTCHGLHKSFEGADYALRMDDPVVADFDKKTILDLQGNSNLCATCHQTRTAEPNIASPGETFRISNTHYGPHHGPQGNLLVGVGFAEIPGSVAYPAANSAKHLTMASCTGCHMAPFSKSSGGHSFKPNLDACNSCHGATNTDFNYGGVQTEVEHLLVQLRDKLMELGVVEYVEADAAYEPIVGTYPMVQAQAYFNWIGIEEDRSLGAHNPKYIKALLLNTIEALQ